MLLASPLSWARCLLVNSIFFLYTPFRGLK